MDQCFNIKGKKLLEHYPEISKANVYKHALGNTKTQGS